MSSFETSYVHPRGGLARPGGQPLVLVRTKPIGTLPDDQRACESLCSWLARLNAANGLSQPGEAMRFAGFGFRSHFDVPLRVDETVRALSNLSGRATAEILPMLLNLYSDDTPQSDSYFVLRDWAIPTRGVDWLYGVRHVVCPECVAQDRVPYWRRSWRLALTLTCVIHGREMLDRCPTCAGVFAVPRHGYFPLNRCGWCKARIERGVLSKTWSSDHLIWKVLHALYDRETVQDATAVPKPCRSLRRLLDLACSAAAKVSSIESLAHQRARSRRHIDHFGFGKSLTFIKRPIAVRARAVRMIEDFARRRHSDFQALVQSRATHSKWLEQFHDICAMPQLLDRAQWQIADVT